MIPFARMPVYGNAVVLPDIKKFDSGYGHAVILYGTGELYAWGLNGNGQFGEGTTTNYYTGWKLIATSVQDVWCGQYSTLYRRTDNAMMYAGYGGTINTTATNVTTFTDVTAKFSTFNLDTVTIMPAWYGTFVLDGSTLYGIGINNSSFLGLTGTQASFTQTLTNVAEVHCGGTTAMVRLLDGSLQSVGGNAFGEGGRGTTGTLTAWGVSGTASSVGGAGVRRFVCGYVHNVIMTDESVIVVGRRSYGTCGDGYTSTTENNRSTFFALTTYTGTFSTLKPGKQYGAMNSIIANNDGIWVTGSNTNRQLGVSNSGQIIGTFRSITPPVEMQLIKQVHLTAFCSMYLTTDGRMFAAGANLPGYTGAQETFVQITLPK